MRVVFRRDQWEYTMSPDYLTLCSDGVHIRRNRYVNESLSGVIHYADVQDKELEKANLELILQNNIPCWPNPSTLLEMLDRHDVMWRCVVNGFVNHPIYQLKHPEKFKLLDYPFVVKTGQEHRGIGKYLVKCKEDFPVWDGIATIEPFFKGDSVRILLLGDHVFGIYVLNETSWIANSSGAESSTFAPDEKIIKHARSVAEEFKLDVAGVDYIVEKDGTFHFLEINQYPGLDFSDEGTPIVEEFLDNKMQYIENLT